jgi:hypothetical protein
MENSMEILVDFTEDEGVYICNECSATWPGPLGKVAVTEEEMQEWSPLCMDCMEPAW